MYGKERIARFIFIVLVLLEIEARALYSTFVCFCGVGLLHSLDWP